MIHLCVEVKTKKKTTQNQELLKLYFIVNYISQVALFAIL